MNQKIKIIHFHNCSGGGVLSVIKNLIAYSDKESFENHIIYTINKKQISNFIIPEISGAASQQIFKYSPHWNFYYTCKKLAALLPADAVLIMHDWLEVAVASVYGLQQRIIQVLHGDYEYYYDLAVKNKCAIDTFISVADNIAINLKKIIPERKADIFYLRFPIPDISLKIFDTPSKLKILFAGRLTADKGYDKLPLIDAELTKQSIEVEWHIAGKNGDQNIKWGSENNVTIYGEIVNDKLLGLMKQMNILILPSIAEGMPVVVIEAMKTGLICICNNINGGIQEMISDTTGYLVDGNNISEYVSIILNLNANKNLLEKIGGAASIKSNNLFDPYVNTRMFEAHFIQKHFKEKIKREKVYGSLLDEPWIPNFITEALRKFSSEK
ncbi:hypothetical protein BH09BAC2_BH09BAC2_15820 [soil metagenome]